MPISQIKPLQLSDKYHPDHATYYHQGRESTMCINIETSISRAIKRYAKTGKRRPTSLPSLLTFLGCTIPEYAKYLESQWHSDMSWENYGKFWKIYYIKPLKDFDCNIAEQLSQAFHYTNREAQLSEGRGRPPLKLLDDDLVRNDDGSYTRMVPYDPVKQWMVAHGVKV